MENRLLALGDKPIVPLTEEEELWDSLENLEKGGRIKTRKHRRSKSKRRTNKSKKSKTNKSKKSKTNKRKSLRKRKV